MDFRLSDDQRAVQTAMRELLAAHFPREKLRQVVDAGEQDQGFDRALWHELGKAGFFSLRLPEKDGGAGLGLPEAVLLFEEAGRALLAGPLVATHLAAGVVPGAAEGTAVVTALDRPGMVGHLAAADAVLLLDGPAPRILRTGGEEALKVLAARPVRSVDPATPLHHIERLSPLPGATPLSDAGDAARLRREAALLTAAEQLGSALRTLEMAVRHVKNRSQFGRPIGAFQAVQHLCARMLVRTELARSSVYAASPAITVSDTWAAKVLSDEAAVRNARDCLQLHGGTGFTWEAEVHLHLKRAWLRLEHWQTPADGEEALAAALLDGSENCSTEIANHPNGAT
ncbi:acyl-CoA dehydrogenase family protein [Streptomyces cinnamoneus]|uniref:Acyl-CoA dehydrogenase n=1 Tax=Streptomyces cinnamoneus TaxID=53446 RepID=A0A918TW45_STRCJ|nr:acyl-CoA dehydrogenase family protein [Streptomyces cinnamoneus]GHC61716.1 acyl-CoA dehydrogenase [Streptomyces cinnamoneus]